MPGYRRRYYKPKYSYKKKYSYRKKRPQPLNRAFINKLIRSLK